VFIGRGPIGKFALTEVGNIIVTGVFAAAGLGAFTPAPIVFAASVYASSGVGAFTPAPRVIAASVYASAGVGAMTPVLHSFNGSVFTSAGIGTLNPQNTRIDNRAVAFSGVGGFSAFSYAFFLDADRACLHQELRATSVTFEDRIARVLFDPFKNPDAEVADVPAENKVAIVLLEDRVYRVPNEPRVAGNQPRKRIC